MSPTSTRRRLAVRTLGAMTAAVMTLALGSSLAAAQTADPPGPRLGIAVGPTGRISMGAFPGTENGFKIVFGYPGTGTSFSTVRIDGVDTIYGDGSGTFTTPCSGDATQNTCVWQLGDVSVTQRVQVTANPQTGKNDAALISYQLNNVGTTPHAVGVRTMFDTELDNNDGAPFRVPGVGNITTERDFTGGAVPDDFLVFQDLASTSRVASGTLRGGFSTVPDRLVIANWGAISRTVWDFAAVPSRSITSDSAYAAYWNPAPLGPGASRTYSTYYGLGEVSVDNTPPVGVGLTGPASLSANASGYTPNPFDVTATISPNTQVPARNVRATLNVPAGLSTTDPTTRTVGDVNPGDPERPVSWSVTAAPSTTARTLQYSVTVTTDGSAPKTVTRSISIPALQASIATVDGSGQSATAGSAFARPLVAGLTYSNGAPASGQPVTFTVTSGSAQFANGTTTTTVNTGADGRASAPLTAGPNAGPVAVSATSPGVSGSATFSETVTAAQVATVRVVGSGTLPLGSENATFSLDLTSTGTQATGSCQLTSPSTSVRCTSFYEVRRNGNTVTFRGTGMYNNRQPISFTAVVTDGNPDSFKIFGANQVYGGNLTSGNITIS